LTDETTLQQDITRAHRAKALVEDPLIAEAFTALEKSYIEFWRVTRPADVVTREKLFLAINVLGKVQDHLKHVIANGSVAEAELRNLSREADRRRKFSVV
jgi:hypothetical protein